MTPRIRGHEGAGGRKGTTPRLAMGRSCRPSRRWPLLRDGDLEPDHERNSLKPAASGQLQPDDAEHLRLSVLGRQCDRAAGENEDVDVLG